MNTTKRLIGLAITAIMLFALAVAGFAVTPDNPVFEILNPTTNDKYAVGYEIQFKLTVKATEAPDTLKVNGTDVAWTAFTQDPNDATKYSYTGTYAVPAYQATNPPALSTLMHFPSESGNRTASVMLTLDTNAPKLLAKATIAKEKFALLSLTASDVEGLKSITVNGSPVVTSTSVAGQTAITCTHVIFNDGIYTIVVEDLAGNKTTSYAYKEGSTVTMKLNIMSGVTGNDSAFNTYQYMLLLNKLMGNNFDQDDMYYYFLLSSMNSSATSATPADNNALLLYMLRNNSDDSINDIYYYYLISSMMSSSTSPIDNNMILSYLLFNKKTADVEEDNDDDEDDYLKQIIMMNLLTNNASGNNIYSLAQMDRLLSMMYSMKTNEKKFAESSDSWLYYYYLTQLQNQTTPATPSTPAAAGVTLYGYASNFISTKVGEKIFLIPSVNGGVWNFDTDYLTGSTSASTILTAVKSGYTTVTYYVVENNQIKTTTFYVLIAD